MRDVARLAGVSVATVSAVLNNKVSVSVALAERVRSAMTTLDYQPDQVARSLRIGRTNVIGIIVPDISNSFFADIMRGVEDACEKKGYSVILCDSNEDPVRERQHLNTLYARRVDGVLLASSVSGAGHDQLTLRRFPIVFVDSFPVGIQGGAVVVDNLGGAGAATRHLIQLGHRRIAIITGLLARSVGRERLEGYRNAMQEAGILIPHDFIQQGDFHVEGGYSCALRLMKLPLPPTAIFACNSPMTLGLLRALGDLGISCPQQISVVGFDDAEWAISFNPRLTCISQPAFQIGVRATEMLLNKICIDTNGSASYQPNIVLEAELRVRQSTARLVE